MRKMGGWFEVSQQNPDDGRRKDQIPLLDKAKMQLGVMFVMIFFT